VIRRFRDLGMPIEQVRAVLHAPDVTTRNEVIVAHLKEMELHLADTQATVSSLRALLEKPPAPIEVEYRSVPATAALAIAEMVAMSDGVQWWHDAFEELHAALADAGLARGGPDGALFTAELFEEDYGEIVAFVPVAGAPAGEPGAAGPLAAGPAMAPGAAGGRVVGYEVPAAELAVTVHHVELDEIDRTYGALGTFVAEREIGVEGPNREP